MSRARYRSPWPALLPFVVLAAVFAGLSYGQNNIRSFIALNSIAVATGDYVWANINVLGDTVVALAICLPLWRRRPDLVWALAVAAVFATAWVHALKPLFDTPRPPAVLGSPLHIIGPPYKTHSFPSGHATTAFMVAGLLGLGIGGTRVFATSVAVAAVVALSRVVAGVHWPLDVVAGAFGGWLSACLGLLVASRFETVGEHPSVQWVVGAVMCACAVALVIGLQTGFPQAYAMQRALGFCGLLTAAAALYSRPIQRVRKA